MFALNANISDLFLYFPIYVILDTTKAYLPAIFTIPTMRYDTRAYNYIIRVGIIMSKLKIIKLYVRKLNYL